MNLYLFIIWNTAYYKKAEIIDDIRKNFNIQKIVEIVWEKELFTENLSRFYGKKIKDISFKEKACGNAPFTVVIFEDEHPQMDMRITSRGNEEYVNCRVFDKKIQYRNWTYPSEGKVHSRIHGTNTVEETNHDLTLLLGMSPHDFITRKESLPDQIYQNIIGTNGWNSLEELFYVLNQTCNYVVLRNFEELPHSFHIGSHEDIDILAEDLNEIVGISNAKRVFRQKYRVQYMVNIAGNDVQFDFRYVGDNYYDPEWERRILESKELQNGVYIPEKENYRYMLLYHALVHKRSIASDYVERLDDMFEKKLWNIHVLNNYLSEKKYSYVEPEDFSVFYHAKLIGCHVSLKRKVISLYRWLTYGIKKVVRLICC